MKNMCSDIACTMPEHDFRRREEWGTFHKQGDFFRKEKKIMHRCAQCDSTRNTKIVEWESYGAETFRGNLEDCLPQALVPTAQVLLRDLYRANNNKLWNNWKMKRIAAYSDLMEAVDVLHRKGIVIKREKRDRFRTSVSNLTKVLYNEEYLIDIEQFIGVKSGPEPGWMKESKLDSIAKPVTIKGQFLYQLLSRQQEELAGKGTAVLVDPDGNPVLKSTIKKVYAKTIRSLYGLYELVELQRTESWKTFSQIYFDDTKKLTYRDRRRLTQLLGSDLTDFGIEPTSDGVIVAADFEWEYDHVRSSSRASGPYVQLLKQVVMDMALLTWQSPKVLVIENKDLFFNVVQRKHLSLADWSILYGGGYISSTETDFLLKAERMGLKHVYVWPDLDPYGYQIALQIKERLHRCHSGLSLSLFGFHVEWIQRSAVVKNLEQADVREIDRLLTMGLPETVREALLYMRTTGKKAEQEILIREISSINFGNRLEMNSILL